MAGLFITLEGLDNAGKTTVAQQLPTLLGHPQREIRITKELTTSLGQCFEAAYLRTGRADPWQKVLAFAADRLERQRLEVEPALQRGAIVIADRWTASAVAYRMAEVLDPIERSRLLPYVLEVNGPCLKPDIGIYMDIDPAMSCARRGNKPENYNIDFLARVRSEYLKAVAQGELRRVSGDGTESEVASRVAGLISAH